MKRYKYNAPFVADASYILTLFQEANYQIYLVGGCVRDALLKRDIHDYDLCTSATPQQNLDLAKQHGITAIPTGLTHGTITWHLHGQNYEITTFRKDHDYKDFRRPEHVSYTTNFSEDVARRDFTMNALGYNGQYIVDYVGGLDDIKERKVRCVGDPNIRFQEDALRILRAFRFGATLHFTIEKTTYKAMQQHAHLLQHISKERIQDEFVKILESQQVDTLRKLKDANILDVLFPIFKETYHVRQQNSYHIYDVFEHMNVVFNASIGYPLPIRLALFFHDVKKKACQSEDPDGTTHFKGHAQASANYAKEILHVYRFNKKLISYVYKLIYFHDNYVTADIETLRDFMYLLGGDYTLAKDVLLIQTLDNMGKSVQTQEINNAIIYEAITILAHMEQNHEVFTSTGLAIDGNDLKTLGYHGKQIGTILHYLVKYVVHHQDKNNKNDLIEFIGGMKDDIFNRE
ncbi:hypothetical protein A4S06_01845 [Erysipelotrichaceae bacterium MTC7]|nr:hypothetical protein A4S06_01845 [Erysipelotrichaceae bacterium MTC7]